MRGGVIHILRLDFIQERFKIFHPYTVHNDNDTLVGVNKPCFEVKI